MKFNAANILAFAALGLGALTSYGFDWTKMPMGFATTGPGAGAGGVDSKDIPNDTAKTVWAVIAENLTNLTTAVQAANGGSKNSHEAINKEIQAAIGTPSAGLQIDVYKPSRKALDVIATKQYIATLKNSPEADKLQAVILHLEAQLRHDAKIQVLEQRLNALIKSNNGALTWQQRIRLSSELSLLQTNFSQAEIEMREVANRSMISSATDDAIYQQKERKRQQLTQSVETLSRAR